ncbi:MAG TPA: thiol:disulfide interchange protein DsbA/DsbL [Aquabacterium sp.]|uniref:thiol:disulfide interchange protein DsbA/DsbL n=1 Tax=Aquabacterium sp. TaxID=1872578 RepID=UPI002E32EBC5|nr:thiol:disulfide interchange protein DsbA/DsbL [Aquabacterium sp.]HEX5373786.1 thiol:disulfide interchange protein DsbA/DsbL [Aquabacterium sp.]
MNRREFSKQTAAMTGLGLAAGMAPWGLAHAADPVEGSNYVKLSQRAPVSAPAGKVEVVEFFWYGCPHCYHFEPSLLPWIAKLPADVVFRRVPVAFRENPFGMHQRLFYALEGLGLLSTLHAKVFHAMHEEKLRLDTPESITEFVVRHGVDGAKFQAMFNSFGMQSKIKQARALAEAYKIDGVPALGIAGRFFTSVSLNGSPEKTLATTDFLVGQARKSK